MTKALRYIALAFIVMGIFYMISLFIYYNSTPVEEIITNLFGPSSNVTPPDSYSQKVFISFFVAYVLVICAAIIEKRTK